MIESFVVLIPIIVFRHTDSSFLQFVCSCYTVNFHCYRKHSPVLKMAEVLQVELSGVLCQIDGVHILEVKQRACQRAEMMHKTDMRMYNDIKQLK